MVTVGDPYPTGVGVISSIGAFVANKRGELVYVATSDAGEIGIFFRDALGVVTTIVLHGDPVPSSLDPTATFDFDDAPDLAMTKNGDVFFATPLTDTTGSIADALIHYDGVGLIVLAATGVTPTPIGGTLSGIASFGPLTAGSNEVVGRFGTRLSGAKQMVLAVPY
jgi:hypothetical protein